jgi:hypothetical protein
MKATEPVMAGLVPAISMIIGCVLKIEMPGTRPGMTEKRDGTSE